MSAIAAIVAPIKTDPTMMDNGTHAAVLSVDLDAIAANWRLLGGLHPSGPVAAVLKADGYGVGAAPVAARLHREGCRTFFVAHLDEALALRPIVPDATLAALNGLWPGAEREYLAEGITPVLGSLQEIAAWSALARTEGRSLPAFLHLDTGMNRLGVPLAELRQLAADPTLLTGIDIRYVMTHLVASETPKDEVNHRQRRQFAAACALLPAAKRSVANSSGIFNAFPSDLARPGAALYGLNPVPGQENPMRCCVRLRARVLQVRDIRAGDTVGYNGTWAAPFDSRIATLSVGYADGFLRTLSNRAQACFDGCMAPLVGRVSMDLTTFNVTTCPTLVPGDWLELMGPHQDADALAAAAGTNGYEILTSLGPRYRRSYLGS